MDGLEQLTENAIILEALRTYLFKLTVLDIAILGVMSHHKVTPDHKNYLNNRLDGLIEKYETLNKPQILGKDKV